MICIISYLIGTYVFPEGGVSFRVVSDWGKGQAAHTAAKSRAKAEAERAKIEAEEREYVKNYNAVRSRARSAHRKQSAVNGLIRNNPK